MNPNLDPSDVERLLYVARVVRATANLGRDVLGDLYSEQLVILGTLRRVLEMEDQEFALKIRS